MNESAKVLREADEAMAAGNMDGYWAAHADDCVAHIAGNNAFSGTYKGLDEIKALFDKMMSRLEGFEFENHDYLGSDDHAVALQKTRWLRGGKTLETQDTFIFHVENGKISSFHMSSFEQDALDKFLA